MTIRGQTTQPKLWALKAPEYAQEAKELSINVLPPSVNISDSSFTIHDKDIYFGFSAVKSIGTVAAQSIMAARNKKKFSSILDFLTRVNRRKVTTGVFKQLIDSGGFDCFGHSRRDLHLKVEACYEYFKTAEASGLRMVEAETRRLENLEKDRIKAEIDEKVSAAKKRVKLKQATQEDIYWAERETRLKLYRTKVGKDDARLILSPEELAEYEQALFLRKKPELKSIDIEDFPTFFPAERLTLRELINQSEAIGCFLGEHPARRAFPGLPTIVEAEQDDYLDLAGIVVELRQTITRKGDPMAFVKFNDGTETAEAVIFPSFYSELTATPEGVPQEGSLITIRGRVQQIEPAVKMIADKITIRIIE